MWYHTNVLETGPSWPWSYGSCIYNYLCSQCLSPLMWLVRISSRARCTCTASCDKLVSDLRQVGGFLRVLNDIAEILLKVALTTIRHTSKQTNQCLSLLCNISWSTASMTDRGYFLTYSYLMAFKFDMIDTFLIIQFLKYSREVPQRYLPSGQNSDNTMSSLSWDQWGHFRTTVNCRLENVDVQRGKICWCFGSRILNRYRSLIFISLVSVWEVIFF